MRGSFAALVARLIDRIDALTTVMKSLKRLFASTEAMLKSLLAMLIRVYPVIRMVIWIVVAMGLLSADQSNTTQYVWTMLI
jgi:hypothetical protein